MKIYKLSSLEEYKNFIRDVAESDQPIFVYVSVDDPHLVGVSQKEVVDPDELFINSAKSKQDDIINENEPLFDDDDFDDLLLLI